MIVNIQVPCVKGYNEDQIMIVMDDPNMKECPVLLGTPTIYHVMPVIKERWNLEVGHILGNFLPLLDVSIGNHLSCYSTVRCGQQDPVSHWA